jgi:hypothetical protein
MDCDYQPSFKGLIKVFKRACCAHLRLYSVQHVGSQGLQRCIRRVASRIVLAFPARRPARMQSSYKETAVNGSETEQTMSNVLHVDLDIGPVRVVPALMWTTGLRSCQSFCMLLSKKNGKHIFENKNM